jgi:hypothetical protein
MPMAVSGKMGAGSSTSPPATRANTNVYAAATTTAHARARQFSGSSMRSAWMPPAPTPATMPVTASPASADTGIPTSSDQPMARTTAPGARGCSDRKASATKTKGITVSPTARPSAALGSASLLEPSFVAPATSPANNAQNARTSTSVATRIARHFLAGGSGCMPAGPSLLRDARAPAI